MVIHVTPRPLFRMLSTRHIITLINLVCRIGLIRIITWPSPNTINKTGIIIATPHRVNGDTTPPSHIVNHLTNIQLQYSFSRTTIIRINLLGKEDRSLRQAWATNSNFRRLKIPSKFSSHRSLLYFRKNMLT